METLIASAFATFAGGLCGFLYGLWCSQRQLLEAMEAVDEACETFDRAKIAFQAAIQTYDDTQKVREQVEKATGVVIVPVRGRVS